METIEKKELATELQELYLENKEWLSDILFMEDEIRFFQNLFDKVITSAIHEHNTQELQPVNQKLAKLDAKRQTLKETIIKNQHRLEALIKTPEKAVGLELIEENTEITQTIKTLFVEEKAIRKNLYALAEKLFGNEKKNHLLNA